MTSIIKVDNLQNQCGANIISESANVITIGASGDTVTLAAGASQSGFGRSGSVNWDTTPKTTGFTAVSGNGYFCNTTSAAFTVTLPATPAAGDIVAIADYNGTAATNNITIGRNSSNINGSATNFTISINYAAISFVYVDATAGWRSVDTSNIANVANQFVLATGGTITTSGDYKIHTFTGPGTFTVTSAGTPVGSDTVDYLVIAGGGGGGNANGGGGGGGAGGYRESSGTASGSYTVSPLGSGVSALPVSATAYPISVGGGGSGGYFVTPAIATAGTPSVFSTITSAGGGKGAQNTPLSSPQNGGSGGGGSYADPGGTGNTPPVAPPQGSNGGNANGNPPVYGGGGGGGATAVGTAGSTTIKGNGGAGATSSINGTPTGRAGGGGGGGIVASPGGCASNGGGAGGGGTGGTVGTINTGGGGGGAGGSGGGGGAGGSGIVVIRYKFQ
jgi:hypothetical protein